MKSKGTKYFSRMNYHVRRGLLELYTEHSFTEDEWKDIMDYFNHSCAYCGTGHTGNNRTGVIPDHLIPAAKHGDFKVGNIIPACQDCNDKRGKKDWRQFIYEKHSSNADVRIELITNYLEKNPYKPAEPSDRLTKEELEKYSEILQEWDALLEKARELKATIAIRKTA